MREAAVRLQGAPSAPLHPLMGPVHVGEPQRSQQKLNASVRLQGAETASGQNTSELGKGQRRTSVRKDQGGPTETMEEVQKKNFAEGSAGRRPDKASGRGQATSGRSAAEELNGGQRQTADRKRQMARTKRNRSDGWAKRIRKPDRRRAGSVGVLEVHSSSSART